MEQSNSIDFNVLKEGLKQEGYKLTPQRRAIVDTTIDEEGGHLTAEEIYDEVKKGCPEIGLAIVYRTIILLEELGVIRKLDLNDGRSGYELVRKDEGHRHHHLVYNGCKSVIKVQDDLLDELEEEVERSYGFKILDHSVKFFGPCRKYRSKMDNNK